MVRPVCPSRRFVLDEKLGNGEWGMGNLGEPPPFLLGREVGSVPLLPSYVREGFLDSRRFEVRQRRGRGVEFFWK